MDSPSSDHALLPAASDSALGRPSLAWVLRVGTAACFIGHGSLGLQRSAAWLPYFARFGIGAAHARAVMPWIGAFDIALALLVLLAPFPLLLLYMSGWALWTAILRPLAGESVWEAVERAGNYGAPFALFLLLQAKSGGERRARLIELTLLGATVLLLAGHGMLQLSVRKPMFCAQYAMLGLPGATLEPCVGAVELALAGAVLFRPSRGLLSGIVAWKLATEALCPLDGASFWVFVEHGGSYAAPLALALIRRRAPVRGSA